MGKIVVDPRNEGDAGYFRIGNLILDIPPDQIQCHKAINSDEVMPLRFPFAMPIKTGQSRWDVTWSWKAILDFSSDTPYLEWENVQTLLAMFKAAPFIEVENEHIRQIVNPSQLNLGATQDDAMAFALRQMRVDTVPDLQDTLQITMTMSLFNYKPYSFSFQYDDGTGNPASSALNSPIFDAYLNTWIQTNLDSDPTDANQGTPDNPAVSSPDWMDQNPGGLTLSWREYRACELPQPVIQPAAPAAPAPANPAAPPPGNTTVTGAGPTTGGFPANPPYAPIISPISPSNPDIQYFVKAMAAPESANNYSAINLSTDPTTGISSCAVGLLQWIRGSALTAMAKSDSLLNTHYISIAQQYGFLVPKSGVTPPYTFSNTYQVSNPQSSNPTFATYIAWMLNPPVPGGQTQLQNDMATAWAITLLTNAGGNVMNAWIAQGFEPGDNQAQINHWFQTAVNSWRGSPGHAQDFYGPINAITTAAPTTTTPTAASIVTSPPTSAIAVSNSTVSTITPPVTTEIQTLMNQGWLYDYFTEKAAFLYLPHNIHLASQDPVDNDTPSSTDIPDIDPDFFVYPTQISVVFMNNIAQIPLAGYQYSTYQHMGPVSTLVSLGLLSVADIESNTDNYSEPEHRGLSLISDMTNTIEDQFQRLRTEWRRVNSIQRMQAVSVKSQILNLLGIRGLLTKEFTTETVPDAANLVSAQYNAIQYENVFETIGPFSVATVPAQFGQQWLTLLRSGVLNQFAGNNSYTTLTNLSSLMQNPMSADAQQLLFTWLTSASPAPDPSAYLVPVPIAFTAEQTTILLQCIEAEPAGNLGQIISSGLQGATTLAQTLAMTSGQQAMSFKDLYPTLANQIQTHSQMNYSDFFLISNGTPPTSTIYPQLQEIIPIINAQITSAANDATPPSELPIDQLFDIYVGYAVSNNVLNLQSEMVQLQKTPQISPGFTTVNGQTTPGSVSANQDHGCYQDMGFQSITFGGLDYTPAVYFYDNAKALKLTQGQIQLAAQTTATTATALANATPNALANNGPNAAGTGGQSSSVPTFDQNSIQALLSTIAPASYSMTRAFPTFKLFLMEDMSNKPFYAYDNFYSYATVLDMEIIRYRDRPDTAIIKISDLMHLLDQHLYDSTPQGVEEQALQSPYQTQLPNSEALVGPGGAPAGGLTYDLSNQFSKISPQGGDHTFPLKYFPMQTGTKIQVRMGFSNNPDLLTPVFTGQITQLEGDEILQITAQSYMLELISPTPDQIRSDGFAVDSFIQNIFNSVFTAVRDPGNKNLLGVPKHLLSFTGNDPAYGGGGDVDGIRIPGVITPGGGTIDVMSSMLHVTSAKHFGYWQPFAPTDPYLKGYSWRNALASVLLFSTNSPLASGATGLEAGYDRSFENILTTHTFGADGTATITGTGAPRTWLYERPAGYGNPFYHVPKNPDLTPWTLIQDIARRYPEFVLAVKQYGFPYTADATLVFANPCDLYSSRSPLPNEIETQQSSTNPQTFNTWWHDGSSSGRINFIGFVSSLGAQWAQQVLANYDQSINFETGSLFPEYGSITLQIGPNAATLASDLAAHIDAGGIGAFNTITTMYAQAMGSASSSLLYSGASETIGQGVSPIQAQQLLNQLMNNYQTAVKLATTGSTSYTLNDRMKPVRKWHFANGDNIIHNGIALNDKFYNVVKVAGQTVMANQAIAPQYCRVLDCDKFVIDPSNNLVGNIPFTNAYAQSFLRDEVAKMYRGELVLVGNPDIEPFDVIVMLDPSTGITGPIEVDSVIHSFNQETGFITIIKPRAYVIINDALSAPLYVAVWNMLLDMQGQIGGYASKLGINPNLTGTSEGLATGAVVAAGIAAGPWIAGLAGLVGAVSLFWLGSEVQNMNPLGITPLTRFGRPWVGGLEGWRQDDLITLLAAKWGYFKVDEIEPLIYSYRTARGLQII